MAHAAKILADSVSPDGVRLTTFEVTHPRIILAEVNTHRMFSRNSASSRAIPVATMISRLMEHPYVPTHWGKNQKGMQADEELSAKDQEKAKEIWSSALDSAIWEAKRLTELGVHKQITNRLLEPFMWHTAIITATEWSNFFGQRQHKDAHPEFRLLADLMHQAMEGSTPRALNYDDWHLPMVDAPEAWNLEITSSIPVIDIRKVSIGRCARVSYLTHDGKRDPEADVKLVDEKLIPSGHMSPLEHVARPMREEDYGDPQLGLEVWRKGGAFCGNFRGWVQYRKMIQNEHDFNLMVKNGPR
jgi:thymidylate synthase ThyX